MPIHYLILLSRQGKVRLAKWFTTLSPKDKAKIVKDVSQLVLSRRTRMCNFLEYKDQKVVYRRYASLFFIAGCSATDNELISLEIVHRYVEQMDKYYGNVCELDIIFNFQKAYFILDELLLAGEMQESSKKNVLRCISQQDSLEDIEVEEDTVTKIIAWDFKPPANGVANSSQLLLYMFVAFPPIEEVSNALNFDTPDLHVVGGCDLYITKAASDDRKLYNKIEQSLESQYESLLKLSASLSPPKASAPNNVALSLNLSRSSPFGPLTEHSSRRTFAYLIATLNASHSDYDYSHVLRPTDFRRERSLKKIIDEEMSLNDCAIFSYSPEDDMNDDDDGAIWSHNYFFFNKQRKRVCYVYLRGIPIMSHDDDEIMAMWEEDGVATPIGKRVPDDAYFTPDVTAKKRQRYWLGDLASDDDPISSTTRRKGAVRAMSEEMVDSMEV
ncbi:mitogen-activated protein kinase [Talaromyces pinophilus]|uniref:AP-1 complex subunit sigma-1 n=1 Tax=Talaromyces pinophilus TaxID=128442 RepID=A0A6V8HD85_TALPI|nr:mitogen-activated protein kinase [Talaromyces pinophilus]